MKAYIKLVLASSVAILLMSAAAHSQDSPGVSNGEIRIGNTSPYIGPVAAYSAAAQTIGAYFNMVNENGGVKGRRLKWLSEDDGYSPPRTLQQTRKLVESDDVLLMTSVLGTATNVAIRQYLNSKGVPHLFPNSGSSQWNNPEQFKWTVPSLGRPDQEAEGEVYARFLVAKDPDAKIGVIYQNDDFGRDFLQGFRKGIEKVAPGKELTEISYEAAESLVDPQVDSLRSAGVQSLAVFALPKFCAQTIRRAAETGWKPTIVVGVVCTSVDLALRPAGLENAVGVHSGLWMLDPADPRNADDPEVQAFKEFMTKYYPAGNIDFINADAYMNASTLVEILKRAGDDLSRENILKITASMGQWRGPMLVEGVYSNLTPDNYQTITTIPIVRFDGVQWDSVSDN